MPFYMLQVAYKPESFKAMIANPADRRAAADKVAEAVGGKVVQFYFAFGKYDAVVIIEAPDDVAPPARRWRSPPAAASPPARPPSF